MSSELVNLDQIQARIKNGGEGRVVFDSTIALLQGLFPPTKKNNITLANETSVIAPLGGYQYIPGVFSLVLGLDFLKTDNQYS
jgi:lysosomal acid phosphatase